MTRKHFLKMLFGIVAAPFLVVPVRAVGRSIATLDKPRSEWRRLLPMAAYTVLFEEGTEPPGSSPLNMETFPYTRLRSCGSCPLARSAA